MSNQRGSSPPKEEETAFIVTAWSWKTKLQRSQPPSERRTDSRQQKAAFCSADGGNNGGDQQRRIKIAKLWDANQRHGGAFQRCVSGAHGNMDGINI